MRGARAVEHLQDLAEAGEGEIEGVVGEHHEQVALEDPRELHLDGPLFQLGCPFGLGMRRSRPQKERRHDEREKSELHWMNGCRPIMR